MRRFVFPAVIQMQAYPSFMPAPAPSRPWGTYFLSILVLALWGLVMYFVFTGKAVQYIPTAMAKNLSNSPLDGKQSNTVSGAEIPAGVLD